MDEANSNFVNSINSDQTRRLYEYSLSKFLKYCNTDLDSFLRLSQQQTSNLIVNYLVSKKISRQYKLVIFSAIKLACEMNDVILNWKKLHRFIKSEKTGNSINGKLLTSLRTAYAEELNLKKEQTSYNDLLDGLRLGLKAYKIE